MCPLRLNVIPLVLALCLAWSPSATGQATNAEPEPTLSDTEGIFLETHLQGHGVTVEGNDANGGRGLGVKIGYGFTPRLTGFLGVDWASMNAEDPAAQGLTADEYGLAYVDLGIRINFRSGSHAVVPYLDGSVGVIASAYSTVTGTVTYSGTGSSVGGGVQYFFSPHIALNGGLDVTFGSYSQLTIDDEMRDINLGFAGVRMDFGISWYLF